MTRCSRAVSLLLLLLPIPGAHAADPPEIVATNLSTRGFAPLFQVVGPPAGPLLEQVRAHTWHAGCPVPPEDLRQLTLSYWSFDRKPVNGVLIVHKDVAREVTEIFRDLFRHGFLIAKMSPVEDYK